ncbi:MAG: LytTR family DNA-binding domain-containing protein [Flavobacteriales bacterium]|nr:LytTR family DNA-binding domain-containing protein [Flavobacteriales bacterium]
MIRTVIIDDENPARRLLLGMLDRLPNSPIKVVGEADDVNSGVEVIQKTKPDVIFLDVQMHEGTGFDLLQKIENVDFEVVFTTAYNQYAIQAFQFSAFGYLLKPMKLDELKVVVDRLENHLQALKEGANNRVKVLMENYQDERKIKKLIINHMKGFDVSLVEDIIRLEGDGNYTNFILTGNRKIMTSTTLGEYEELLYEHGFYRIHQSTIVNLRHITKYYKGVGGKVQMTDGEKFNVSRYRKAGFLEQFK